MGDTAFLHLRRQKICLNYQQGSFLVNTRPMLSDPLLLPDSEVEEKVLISRQGPVHRLAPTGRIRLEAEALVTLGSDYENRICYSFIPGSEADMPYWLWKAKIVFLHNLGGDGVYHNGRRAQESTILEKEIPCSYTVFSCNFFPHISFMFHWLENAG